MLEFFFYIFSLDLLLPFIIENYFFLGFLIIWFVCIPRVRNFYLYGFWAYFRTLFFFETFLIFYIMLLFMILLRYFEIPFVNIFFVFTFYFLCFMFIYIPLIEFIYYCFFLLCRFVNYSVVDSEDIAYKITHKISVIIVTAFLLYFLMCTIRFYIFF